MTLVDQCVKRVCFFEHRKAWGDRTNASVPAGISPKPSYQPASRLPREIYGFTA